MSIVIKDTQSKIVDTSFLQFPAGERHVQLGVLPKQPIFYVQANIHGSNDLMDLLLLRNALNNAYLDDHDSSSSSTIASGAAVEFYLEIPYLPYARQDRVCAPGQAFSLQVMAQLLQMIKPTQLVVWDCHSSQGQALVDAVNIAALEIIRSSPSLQRLIQNVNSVLVCPDKGAWGRCSKIAAGLQVAEVIRCEKHREPVSGKITHTTVNADDLTGKYAIITDDICDGGYTFIKIAEQLKAKNAAKVVLYVTHGIFSKGLGVFAGLIDEIYTTNSFASTTTAAANSTLLQRIDYQYQFTSL